MSRSRRRISRALLGLLACTIALGLVFWLHNLNKTQAETAAAEQAASASVVAPPPAVELAAPAQPVAPAPATPVALVTQTPTAPVTPVVTPAAPANAPGVATTPSTTQPAAPGTIVITPSAPKPAPAVTQIPYATPIVDARAKVDAGDLLTARTILNTALLAKTLSPADTAIAKKMLGEINQSVVFGRRKFPNDEFGGSYSVKPGDRLQRIAAEHDVTWELLGRLNGLSDPRRMRAGQTLKILKGPFHAVVDKSEFVMDIYLGEPGEAGSVYVTSFPVGLGADDSTPTGVWS